jgi:hypothetical protein
LKREYERPGVARRSTHGKAVLDRLDRKYKAMIGKRRRTTAPRT